MANSSNSERGSIMKSINRMAKSIEIESSGGEIGMMKMLSSQMNQ
jgi:hypothetical protein